MSMAIVSRGGAAARPTPLRGGRVIVGPWAAGPSRSPGRGRRVPLRLTRRGRRVRAAGVAALLVLSVLAGVLLLSRAAAAGPQPGATQVPVTYRVVLPGETLWGLAGRVAPQADRRETLARIKELNDLDGAVLRAGQRIALPVAAGSAAGP